MEILRITSAVQEVYSVLGPYDIIIKIRAETIDKLKEIVKRVRNIESVRSAITMLIIEKN